MLMLVLLLMLMQVLILMLVLMLIKFQMNCAQMKTSGCLSDANKTEIGSIPHNFLCNFVRIVTPMSVTLCTRWVWLLPWKQRVLAALSGVIIQPLVSSLFMYITSVLCTMYITSLYIPSPTVWTNCRTPVNVESLASWLYCSGDEFERAKKWSLESSNLRDHFAQKKWSLLQPPKNVINRKKCDPSLKAGRQNVITQHGYIFIYNT